MSPDIHTLQEAAVILNRARTECAMGSLAVWNKVAHALNYINSQIEVELAEESLAPNEGKDQRDD